MSSSRRSDATSSPPLTATQPERASSSTSSGREALLEADVAPPGDRDLPLDEALGERAQHRGRRRLVDEVEPRLARLAHQRLDPVDGDVRRRRLVARDVVQRHVAERALLPVAAARDGQLVPAPVRPQPVHRVQHLEQRDVAIERQPVVGRRPGVAVVQVGERRRRLEDHGARLAHVRSKQRAGRIAQVIDQGQKGPLAVVERDEVAGVEHARRRRAAAARC